uniref:Uncharacterized protein n=1 Tax=Glossina pallidipes TaxID=7398 RepID=A0A1A9Z8J1_GLOPL
MNTPTLPSLSLPAILLNKLAYHEHSVSVELNSSKTYLHKTKGMPVSENEREGEKQPSSPTSSPIVSFFIWLGNLYIIKQKIYHRAEIWCKQKNILQISEAHHLRYEYEITTFPNLPSYVNQVEI